MKGGVLKKNRNTYLDYVRAISGIAVVLYHYTIRYEQLFGHRKPWPIVFRYGNYGVLTFFVLSGYLTLKKIYVDNPSPWQFAKKRFLKLFPAFFVAMITTMIFSKLFFPELAVSTRDFLLNITMIPIVFGAASVDGAYWTLLCEIAFYGIVFLILLFRGQKQIRNIIYAWSIYQIVILLLPKTGTFFLIRKVNDILYLHCFIIGAIIAFFEMTISEKCHIWSIKDYGLIVVLLFSFSLQFINHELPSGFSLIVISMIVFFSVFMCRSCGDGEKPNKKIVTLFKPLIWIASISYPLYLLHQKIGYIIIYHLEINGLTSEWFIFVPIAVILLLSWVIHVLVESPISILEKKLE